MRFRVNDGVQLQRGHATYTGGEEFEATGEEAQDLLKSGMVARVDEPAPKPKPKADS